MLRAIRSILNIRVSSGLLYIGVASVAGALSSGAILALLPPLESGRFFLAQSLVSLVLVFDFGLLIAGTRAMAFAYGRVEGRVEGYSPAETYRSFRDARLVSLLVITMIGLGALLAPLIHPLSRGADLRISLIVSAAAAAATILSFGYQSVLEGSGQYHVDRLVQTFSIVGTTATIALVAYLTRAFLPVAVGWVCALLVLAMVKRWVAASVLPEILNRSRPQLPAARGALATARSIFFVQIGSALTKNLQFPAIAHFLGASVLGPYFFVARMSQTVDAAISVLAASERALFSRAVGAGQFREARRMMVKSMTYISLASVIAGLVVAVVAPFALRFILPSRSWGDVPFLLIGVDLIMMCTLGNMSQFVVAAGRNPFAKSVFSSGILTILLLYVLVPKFGILGAALSQFLGALLANAWYTILCFARLLVELRQDELSLEN